MAITVGIPKALAFYEYQDLWRIFFRELGCKLIYSTNSNRELLEMGKSLVVDESCLAMKIYMGHIHYLTKNCDYILIPYLESINKKEETCTNFLALYDLTKTLFPEDKILNYHVNANKNITEEKAFLKMGLSLNFNKKQVINAYETAQKESTQLKLKKIKDNLEQLREKGKNKILLVAHTYNAYDKLIGEPIINYLKKQGISVIHAHLNNCKSDNYQDFSKTLYWSYNKNLVNGLALYEKFVDGIIFLTVFPCGPDSLVNELCLSKVTKPAIQIIIDELNSEVGLETRLESFIDIIERKKVNS